MNAHEDLLEALPAENHPLATHRTSSVIVAAIRTSYLTVNEMGEILGAITDRICRAGVGKWPEYPELEKVAHDLADSCEDFREAQDKIDERNHEESIG